MDEYEVLDTIYEAMPEDINFGLTLYDPLSDEAKPALNITIDGVCYHVQVVESHKE